jgi:hypothetical protein
MDDSCLREDPDILVPTIRGTTLALHRCEHWLSLEPLEGIYRHPASTVCRVEGTAMGGERTKVS